MTKKTSRDNIGGIKSNGLKSLIFLFPGKVIQWVQYMSAGNQKGYGKVRTHTRLSRSPLMTWVYSIAFWILLGLFAYSEYLNQVKSPETIETEGVVISTAKK